MPYTEQKSTELFQYLPPLTKKPDFDVFWEETLRQTEKNPLEPRRTRIDHPCGALVYEASYNGFDDTRILGWLLLPLKAQTEKVPCLIHYHGFTGNRGYPSDFMHWIAAGCAVLSVDCREQTGMTGTRKSYSGASAQNVMTNGIWDPNDYYLRALYMDCKRAVDFVLSFEEIDETRIVLEGGSQGGALVSAVSALDHRPVMALADVPSNSDIVRRIEGSHGSFSSVIPLLKQYPDTVDQIFGTLSYFDTMNLADRIRCRTYASVGLMDPVCPARCYFATYNRITAPKQIEIYPFAGHEGGMGLQTERKLRFLQEHL